jgi:hypothetical protein
MDQTVSAVSSKVAMVASMYGLSVPAGGFDADSWEAAIDAYFPVLAESIFLVELFLETAPADCNAELLALLKDYASAWTNEEREVSFA